MPAEWKSGEFRPPLMSAFREAFEAHDSRKREVRSAEGERVIAGRMSRQRRVDEAGLKRDLTIDLLSLLNTVDLGSVVDLDDFPHVKHSIIDYGLRDVAHLTSQEIGVNAIRDDLAAALAAFEPRLDPGTLLIEKQDADDVNQRIRFTVSAEMFCLPASIPIDFVAEIEVGSGKVQLTRLPAAP